MFTVEERQQFLHFLRQFSKKFEERAGSTGHRESLEKKLQGEIPFSLDDVDIHLLMNASILFCQDDQALQVLIEKLEHERDALGQALIERARNLARTLHAGQVRRESGRSFFDAHLEPVARLVQEVGGDAEDIAVAYLHDTIEDVGEHTQQDIEALSYGVFLLVREVTETGDTWEERKAGYLAQVKRMHTGALLVSMCDKTLNAEDFSEEWGRGAFGKRPANILAFFQGLEMAYGERMSTLGYKSHAVYQRFQRALRQMEHLRPN